MAKARYELFRGVLRGAICNTSQAKFAKMSGISPEHLNRMLNAKEINRPSATTLGKIANVAKNGITLQDLTDALDKEDPDYHEETIADLKYKEAVEDFKPEFEELADECFRSLKNSVANVIKSKNWACTDLNDFMASVESAYNKCRVYPYDISYDISVPREYFGHMHDDVTHWVSVLVDIIDGRDIAETEIIIYFSYLPKADMMVIQYADMTGEAIVDLYGFPTDKIDYYRELGYEEEDIMDNILKEPYIVSIKRPAKTKFDKAAAERMLRLIFADDEDLEEYVVEGFGFEITDDIPSNFGNFCKLHKKAILASYKKNMAEYIDINEKLDKLIESDADNKEYAELFSNYIDLVSTASSWKAVISSVMYRETGYEFELQKADEPTDKLPNLSTEDVVMLSDDYSFRSAVTDDTLINIVAKYARQLGLTYFGDIEFHKFIHKSWKGKLRKFKVNYNHEEEYDLDDVSDWRLISDEEPSATGMYWVKLKDGREMKVLFIKKEDKGHWVAFHKEWSDMILAWDMASVVTEPC